MLAKERESWYSFWQEKLESINYKSYTPEVALLLADYYLISYASPWAESILRTKDKDVKTVFENIIFKINRFGLNEQKREINRGLLELDENVLANVPEGVSFLDAQAFSIECATSLHETFKEVVEGRSIEGLAQNLDRARAIYPNLATPYFQTLSTGKDRTEVNEYLNRIYETHRGFFLALREI